MKKNIYAVVIGVENYENPHSFPKVEYARNDARAIYDLFVERYDIPENQILYFVDENTKHFEVQNKISDFLGLLPEDSTFILYYAGHGFFSKGNNYITVYDTEDKNIESKSLDVNNLFIETIDARRVARCLIFMDCCSSEIAIAARSARGMLSMNFEEVIDKAMFYRAVFISCSPHELAYPDDAFQHGVWTYYLKNALQEISNSTEFTDIRLRDYLNSEVLRRTGEVFVEKLQNPYARISASSTVNLSALFFGTSKNKAISQSNKIIEICIDFYLVSDLFGNISGYSLRSSLQDLELSVLRRKYEGQELQLRVSFPQNRELQESAAKEKSPFDAEKKMIYVKNNDRNLEKRVTRLKEAVNILFDEQFVTPFTMTDDLCIDVLNKVFNYFPEDTVSSDMIMLVAVHESTKEYFKFLFPRNDLKELGFPDIFAPGWGYSLIDIFSRAGARIICEFLMSSIRNSDDGIPLKTIGNLGSWHLGVD